MEEILQSPAFVIHLESLKERKDFFMKNITEAGFKDIQIFKGVDARIPDELKETKELFDNPSICWEVSNGAIGCMFSHFKVWKHIIDNKIPIATIFEDDALFHPEFDKLSKHYFDDTPKNFDVIFLGNTLDSVVMNRPTPKITTQSCFCLNAYVVTLKGATELLNMCLKWRSDLFHHPKHKVEGLYCIDIMVKHMQNLMISQAIPKTLTWYCWNGTLYPCDHNTLPLKELRNCGLVFQATDIFGSTASSL
jgi:GR25 family glycosyltransferase involved in LPS biosynthesis